MKSNRVYYRSTIKGAVWCESSNPVEVINRSRDFECEYEKIEYYEITSGWEPWEQIPNVANF